MLYQKKGVKIFVKVFLLLSLIIVPFISHAANYYVWGRVYSARLLYEGEAVPNNPLTGVAPEIIIGQEDMVATTERNLVSVTIVKASDNTTLSTSITQNNGIYFNSFSSSDPGPLPVKIIVTELVNGTNLFQSDSVTIQAYPPVFNIRYILVPEEPHEIGNGRDYPSFPLGTGEYTGIFTRVGKIELEHDGTRLIDTTTGLATVENPIAGYLDVPEYVDSPFGGNLFLFGAFSADLYNYPNVRYRIRIDNLETGGLPTYVSAPLRKTKYTVNTSTMTVDSVTVTLGPEEVAGVSNCYKLTDLSVSNSEFYSYPDLLAIWPTSGLNGRHRISIEVGFMPAGTLFIPFADYTSIVINLDNVAPIAAILPIASDPVDTPRVYTPGPLPPVDLSSSYVGSFPGDYGGAVNHECMILNMDDTEDDKYLALKLSAYHSNGYEGYIRYWNFRYYRNDDKNEILIGKKYDPLTPSVLTDYFPGIRISTAEDSTSGFLNKYLYLDKSYLLPAGETGCSCAYRFRIAITTRTTNGYQYLRWREDNDYHYIQLCP
ncbi:MAG: hypothetical protein JXJ04_17385 [Spirochaetales bacterium]|nr:hypothetical protein [Spirochaetales bacterium]